MAFNVSRPAVGILERALTGNVWIENNLAYMNEGDKDGYSVYKHDLTTGLRARTDNPGSQTNGTFAKNAVQRSLTVLESYQTFNPADYHNHWREYQPEGNFDWETLPKEVQNSLENLFLGGVAEAVEGLLTNGGTDFTSGLIDQLDAISNSLNGAAATSAQIINSTHLAFKAGSDGSDDQEGVALTTANVFQKLEILIKNQTKAMRKRAGRKFMVSHGTADLIREAQRLELNFKGVDVTAEGVMRYAGYDIFENPSFPDDTIIFCSMTGDMKTDAIQMGTSMSSDFNNLEVERVSNFGRLYGMLLTFAIDIYAVRPEEICYYQTSTL
mgnify:CR=1 FL=1|tara:strand:- start:1703 stop:2683 length:981 start_codon:yes stop_codon:yes gene_type:complete